MVDLLVIELGIVNEQSQTTLKDVFKHSTLYPPKNSLLPLYTPISLCPPMNNYLIIACHCSSHNRTILITFHTSMLACMATNFDNFVIFLHRSPQIPYHYRAILYLSYSRAIIELLYTHTVLVLGY